jgi:hypothetical protein
VVDVLVLEVVVPEVAVLDGAVVPCPSARPAAGAHAPSSIAEATTNSVVERGRRPPPRPTRRTSSL